ncbi:tyrosine-protein phosphatase non-receptor type substrate 1-like isoform X1 [Mytilus californianus]|uniref:tyrosine-protein phosphatase non-receptor type substrate 1-like isoform X1 n=1 Tax=Mytilus californianus TaxID=6549 RepID=UPI002245F0D2|nr:tyrosine-protein phosphatase non-receptor type substrate 1-like isoform X1 [Mytilus californianus]XP_052099429.1 tyrosine-protein phosphatase non-receptor type substrate 1-like isoform X1 [Mytilus californianus]
MMIRNGRLYKISRIIYIQYYIVEAVLFLSAFSALSVKGLQANVPFFEPRENNVSFYAGETATLLCSVTGLQTRFVVWRRTSEPNPLTIGDFVYSPDDRITIRRVEDKNEWNLIIKDVQIADAGVYECAVSSREKYKRLVLLRVNGTSRRLNSKGLAYDKDQDILKSQVLMSGQRFVSKGQTILLTCNATGEDYAPDGVDWFINGHKANHQTMPRVRIYDPVVDNNKRTLLSTLEIRRSIMNDKGIYVCRGPDQKTSSLTVHILDEEKSSIDKRGDGSPSHGFVSDSAIPCCSFKWSKQCAIVFLGLSATWFTHAWFVT